MTEKVPNLKLPPMIIHNLNLAETFYNSVIGRLF